MEQQLTIYEDVVQGSDQWHNLRCGILTASEMSLILTPTLKLADNEKTRSHFYDLMAQRITRYVEPQYISDDMLRGKEEEFYAREEYIQRTGNEVATIGFMELRSGITSRLGYSPDGLVGDEGLIECKSRRNRFQVETFLTNEIPFSWYVQMQTGLFISGRDWCDYVSYSGGMPTYIQRVYPETKYQEAIEQAWHTFENKMQDMMEKYNELTLDLKPTKRTETEILV